MYKATALPCVTFAAAAESALAGLVVCSLRLEMVVELVFSRPRVCIIAGLVNGAECVSKKYPWCV